MKLILDTHTILWFMGQHHLIPEQALNQIACENNQIFISQASLMELSIKISLGKLKLNCDWHDLLFFFERGKWTILPLDNNDLFMLSTLPFHHGDPFDRMIACQCINQEFQLISKDTIFDQYHVQRFWE